MFSAFQVTRASSTMYISPILKRFIVRVVLDLRRVLPMRFYLLVLRLGPREYCNLRGISRLKMRPASSDPLSLSTFTVISSTKYVEFHSYHQSNHINRWCDYLFGRYRRSHKTKRRIHSWDLVVWRVLRQPIC